MHTKNLLPIVYLGDDFDDFSIFHLAVQELSSEQIVLRRQYSHTLLQDLTAGSCIVVDVSARWTPIEYNWQDIEKYAMEINAPIIVYTSDVQWVTSNLKEVSVKAFVSKTVHFESLVIELKRLLCLA